MGILDGIVDWLATQVMNLLDMSIQKDIYIKVHLSYLISTKFLFIVTICNAKKPPASHNAFVTCWRASLISTFVGKYSVSYRRYDIISFYYL